MALSDASSPVRCYPTRPSWCPVPNASLTFYTAGPGSCTPTARQLKETGSQPKNPPPPVGIAAGFTDRARFEAFMASR
jgi:hypothetical protein